MIKTVKAFKAKWIGSNLIGLTVYHPDSSVIQLIVNLKDFTVESNDESSIDESASEEVVVQGGVEDND